MTNFIDTELQKFDITDAVIESMKDQFLPMKINGIEDDNGYRQVNKARLFVKNKRVEIEKRRKELKADSLEYGRRIDAQAKYLTELIAPIELHLEKEQDAVDKERERTKIRKAREAALPERINKLAELGVFITDEELMVMDDLEFNRYYNQTKEDQLKARQAELERQEREQEKKARHQEAEIKRKMFEIEEAERALQEAQKAAERIIQEEKDKAELAKKAAAAEVKEKLNPIASVLEDFANNDNAEPPQSENPVQQELEKVVAKRTKVDFDKDQEQILAAAHNLTQFKLGSLEVTSKDAQLILREAQIKLDMLIFYLRDKAKLIGK